MIKYNKIIIEEDNFRLNECVTYYREDVDFQLHATGK